MGRQRNQYKPVTEKEREAILAEVRKGRSRHAVAQEFGRSRTTVANIAREAGLTADTTSVEAANRARSEYATEQRISLINEAFSKAEAMLRRFDDNPQHAKNFRELVTAIGILIDKRRLEDGDVTERTETVTIVDDVPRE